MRELELLSPAKNKEVAFSAINNGADAVYIGGPAFGARKAVGNSLDDIHQVVVYAHRFYCRVFVALNTILYDSELLEAERLIRKLYHIGVDAIIVQDPAILKLDIPPISLHASTQMHNYELERIRFLDQLGFQRIVLARELSLEQIRQIRKTVKAELEFFVHGALCVSLSGQCYISHYLTGRSANRGECAQACRMRWSVEDKVGQILVKDKYVLSLKDLNLSARLGELAEAGIDSFKIEGRLKEVSYVANVTNYYSKLLDELVGRHEEWTRVGSGLVKSGFESDLARSFNRGYSEYFINGRSSGLVNMDTPKSMGKYVGKVVQTKGNKLIAEVVEPVHNADGLCYLVDGELKGIKINRVDGSVLQCSEYVRIAKGTPLFRNYDHLFFSRLEKNISVRKMAIYLKVYAEDRHFVLSGEDEDGNHVVLKSKEEFELATNPKQRDRICEQLQKCGDSDFVCVAITYCGDEILFIPMAVLNAFRRQWIDKLLQERANNRKIWIQSPLDGKIHYEGGADWRLNIVNRQAREFYQEHGVEAPEPGFEVSEENREREVMTTRYCLLYELDRCRKSGKDRGLKYPLYLFNNLGRFRLEFECGKCFMRVIALR